MPSYLINSLLSNQAIPTIAFALELRLQRSRLGCILPLRSLILSFHRHWVWRHLWLKRSRISAFSYLILVFCSILCFYNVLYSDNSLDMQYVTSSIEILIIDQAEHLLMQNWATVQEVVGQLNQRPTRPSLASPARIRLAYLAGFGSRYRQTLLFSAVSNHLISALISKCESELLWINLTVVFIFLLTSHFPFFTDFQGLNLFLPMPQYRNNSLFAGYLPESHRVPGLNSLSSGSSKKITALDNFKLQLITFGVTGSLLNSNSLAELTKRVDPVNSDEEEEGVCAKRARIGDVNSSIVLKGCLAPYSLSDKGDFPLNEKYLFLFLFFFI